MKERIITALCLIAIVVPAVIFGGIFYKIVIGVAMALSVYEMLHICFLLQDFYLTEINYLFLAILF